MKRVRWILAILLLLGGVTSCIDNPYSVGPRAGTLRLQLSTPRADDGAVLFEVSGPEIESVVAANASLLLFSRRTNGDTIAGVILGVGGSGTVATLRVPNDAAASEYRARVLEVADRQDGLRASLAGYVLTVEP